MITRGLRQCSMCKLIRHVIVFCRTPHSLREFDRRDLLPSDNSKNCVYDHSTPPADPQSTISNVVASLEQAQELAVVGFAAFAVGRARELGSRCLAQSRHRLTRHQGDMNDRCRGGCSHPARQAAGCSANSRSNVSCSKSRTHTVDPQEPVEIWQPMSAVQRLRSPPLRR